VVIVLSALKFTKAHFGRTPIEGNHQTAESEGAK